MIDVAIAIDAEAVPVKLRKVSAAAGSYVDGKWIAAAPSVSGIMATVQPASGRQLNDLPEGIRTTARFIVWSRTPIIENDEIILGDGTEHRVMFVWPRPGDGFCRAAIGLLHP